MTKKTQQDRPAIVRKAQLLRALEMGFNVLGDYSKMNWQNMLTLLTQPNDGTTVWSKAIAEGAMTSKDLVWAIHKTEGFIGARVQTKEGPMFFDLRDKKDLANFKQFENYMTAMLRQHKR